MEPTIYSETRTNKSGNECIAMGRLYSDWLLENVEAFHDWSACDVNKNMPEPRGPCKHCRK